MTEDPVLIARYQRESLVAAWIFCGCLLAPLYWYVWGGVDEKAAWPAAIGFSAATGLPWLYLKWRFSIFGGNFKDFLAQEEAEEREAPRGRYALYVFILFAAISALVSAVALYQLMSM